MVTFHLSRWFVYGVISLIVLLLLLIKFRKRLFIHASDKQSASASSDTVPPPVTDISIPKEYQGKQLAYHYFDVDIIPVPSGCDHVVVGKPLSFIDQDTTIHIFQGDYCIGTMKENRISGMIRDWHRSGDPILSYVSSYAADDSKAQIGIGFYMDLLAKFMRRHSDAKLYKLVGKPDDLAFDLIRGSMCDIEEDEGNYNRFNITNDNLFIGRLPSSAIRYAESNDLSPEDLDVCYYSREYDPDKDHDVVYVYIGK